MPYEIKPLVWSHIKPVGSLDYWSAWSGTLGYRVVRLRSHGGRGGDVFEWMGLAGDAVTKVAECTSFDDGKAQCEAHYQARVLECLVEVQT